MLRLANLEEIQKHLMQIPALTDLQESHDFLYVAKGKLWLADLEKILSNNRIMQAGEIATLRGIVISAEDGITPAELVFLGNLSKRKTIVAAAAFAVRRACDVVLELVQGDVARFAEAERMMRQLIAIAKAKGLLQQIPHNGNPTEILRYLWLMLSNDQDIVAGTTNVEGLVGQYDALILLDRLIAVDIPKE